MKGQFGLLLTLAAVLLLCGCQPTPDTEAVTSKNDGALEAALESTAIPAAATAGVQTCSYTDSFQNTAGNITYTVDAQNVEISVTALPVLQVTPHAFTGEEAQTIAAALFGDAEAYEYTAERSRAELEEAILEKRRFLSDRAALLEIYGGDEEMADAAAAEAEDSLANLEALYQTAPDTVER